MASSMQMSQEGTIIGVIGSNRSSREISEAIRCLKRQSGSSVLVQDVEELRAVAKKIWTVLQFEGVDASDIELLTDLLRLVPENARKDSPLVTEAFQEDALYVSALQEAFDTFSDILDDQPLGEGGFLQTIIKLLLEKVQDLSQEWKAPGPNGKVKGRQVCGAAFLGRLLRLVKIGGERGELSLARDALVTAAILLHSVEENVKLLGSSIDVTKAWLALLVDFLPNCGDAPIQEGILELMYRAGRKGAAVPDAPHFTAEFLSAYETLQSTTDRDMVIWQEVRPQLLLINAFLKENASVASFQAEQITFGTKASLTPEECWVDLGDGHLSVRVVLPGEQLLDAEPVDVPFDHLRRVRITTEDGADGQQIIRLQAQLAELPDILSAMLLTDSDTQTVRVEDTFLDDRATNFSMCVTHSTVLSLPAFVTQKVPFVKMLQQALLSPPSEQIENTFREMSQRPDRISIAMCGPSRFPQLALEKPPRPVPTAQKAPLQLLKVVANTAECKVLEASDVEGAGGSAALGKGPTLTKSDSVLSPQCGQPLSNVAELAFNPGHSPPLQDAPAPAQSDLFVVQPSATPEKAPSASPLHAPAPEPLPPIVEDSGAESQQTSMPNNASMRELCQSTGAQLVHKASQPTRSHNSHGRSQRKKGGTLKKVARRQTRAQQRKEEVKRKAIDLGVPMNAGKEQQGPVRPDSAPNWLLNAKPLTAEKGAKPDVYDWLADTDDEPEKEPLDHGAAGNIVQGGKGRKKESVKAAAKTTRAVNGKAVKGKKQPQNPTRKPPARARKSTNPAPSYPESTPPGEGRQDKAPNTPTSQVLERPNGARVGEAAGKRAIPSKAQTPRRSAPSPASKPLVCSPSPNPKALDSADPQAGASMSPGIPQSPPPRPVVSETKPPRGRRRRCSAPSPEAQTSMSGGCALKSKGDMHADEARNASSPVSSLAAGGGQAVGLENAAHLAEALDSAAHLAVFKGTIPLQHSEKDASRSNAAGNQAPGPVQAGRGRPAKNCQVAPDGPAHQGPFPKRGRPSRKRQAEPVPVHDGDQDEDDFELPRERRAKMPRTRGPRGELENPNPKSKTQKAVKAKTGMYSKDLEKENVDPNPASARKSPRALKGKKQALDVKGKGRKAEPLRLAKCPAKPHAEPPPSPAAPASSDSHKHREGPGDAILKEPQVPSSAGPGTEAIKHAAKEWAALDEEELAVEPAEPASPESSFAGILEKLKLKRSTDSCQPMAKTKTPDVDLFDNVDDVDEQHDIQQHRPAAATKAPPRKHQGAGHVAQKPAGKASLHSRLLAGLQAQDSGCSDLSSDVVSEEDQVLFQAVLPTTKKTPSALQLTLPGLAPKRMGKAGGTIRDKIMNAFNTGDPPAAPLTAGEPDRKPATRVAKAAGRRATAGLTKPLPGRGAQRGKAPTPAPLGLNIVADDSGEEGEENAAAPLIAMLGKISQEADSDEDEAGLGELQSMLQRVMKSKQSAARKKQLGIVQDVQAKLAEQVAELKDQSDKDAKATTNHVQKGLTDLVAALDKEMAAMKATEEALRAQMGEHWARYQEIFDQLRPFQEELVIHLQKRQANRKRKLKALSQDAAALLADARSKIARTTSKSAKLYGLASMLRPFI